MRSFKFPLLPLIGLLVALAAHADELSDVQRLYYGGQSQAAMQRADRYLNEHPKDPQMRFLKSLMLADAKHNAEAAALLHAISADYPDLAEPYNNLAVLYAAGGDYDQARAALEQALRNNPSYATAQENLGDVYAALAAQAYARALKLDPNNVTVPPKLALVRQLYKVPGAAGMAAKSAASIAPAASAPR